MAELSKGWVLSIIRKELINVNEYEDIGRKCHRKDIVFVNKGWTEDKKYYIKTYDYNAPEEFFKLLLLYILSNSLGAIYLAISFGEKEVNVMLKQIDKVMEWFDNCNRYIPNWYYKVNN